MNFIQLILLSSFFLPFLFSSAVGHCFLSVNCVILFYFIMTERDATSVRATILKIFFLFSDCSHLYIVVGWMELTL